MIKNYSLSWKYFRIITEIAEVLVPHGYTQDKETDRSGLESRPSRTLFEQFWTSCYPSEPASSSAKGD